MRRRFVLPCITAALLLATIAAPAIGEDAVGAAACPGGAGSAGFTDVSSGNVHAAAIDCAASLGVLAGTGADRFSPAGAVSRGQVASLLVGSLERLGVRLPPSAGAPGFPDEGATHGQNIRRLAAAGIVSGFADGTYRPHQHVTREQLASVLVRTLSYVRTVEVTADGPADFPDVTGGAHAAAIAAAVEESLLAGRGDGFAPRATTRRDQAATAVVRLLDRAAADVRGEVWSLDQGTDLIHVYDGRTHTRVAEIDVSPAALRAAGFDAAPSGPVTVPHMVEFDSQERFAFVASTAGAVTIVIDARRKEVVEVLATGAGTHMAAVTPDDSAVWVAAIAATQMVEIPLDLSTDDPTFAIGRRIGVADLLEPLEDANGWDFPSYQPVCHQFSPDSSEAWVTLGPGWNQGGLFVLDLASGVATHAFDPDLVKANCGISVSEERAVANWSGAVIGPDEDTNGEWYVFDARSKELLSTHDAEGFDAHGVRLSPDGTEYWMVNRISDNALVVDATTFEVTRRYTDIANTPDILAFDPDGSRLYVSQRGPSPRSGGVHAAAGTQPGVRVIDTATGATLAVLEPGQVTEAPSADHPQGRILNDVHGVAFRARGTGQASVSAASLASVDGPRVVPAVEVPASTLFHCSVPA